MSHHRMRQVRFVWPALAVIVLTIALSLTLRSSSRATNAAPHVHDHSVPMTEQSMRAWVDQWFSAHPMVGRSSTQGVAVASDTFLVGPGGRLIFDTDGNVNTPVDTAKIQVGQTILWRWISGSHTVTSGTGFADPQAGALFDMPMTSTSTMLQFTFTTAGDYPFFCRPHEGLGMVGFVHVTPPLSVPPTPAGPVTLGFTASPAPNPSHSVVDFQFAMRQSGRVKAEVFDGRGRRVAVVLDRELDGGPHTFTWDGRSRSGSLAPAGVYYLRLSIPGFTGSRQVVIER